MSCFSSMLFGIAFWLSCSAQFSIQTCCSCCSCCRYNPWFSWLASCTLIFPLTCLELAWIIRSTSLSVNVFRCFQPCAFVEQAWSILELGFWAWRRSLGTQQLQLAKAEIGHCGNHCDPWDPPRNSGPDSNGLHPSADVDIVVENPCIEHTLNTHGSSLTSMETRSPFVYDSIDSWLVCTGHLGIQSLSWISGSQFFITLGSGALAHVSSHCSHVNRPWLLRPQPSLDGKHAIFGRVCRGMKATAYLEDLSIWRIIPKFYCRCGSIVSYCFWCLCFRARWFRNWAQLLPMHRRFPQKFRIFNRFSDTFLFRPVWRCLIMSYIMSYQLMVQDKPIQEAGRSQARSVFFWSRSSDKLCVQVKILRASTALAADANLGLWPDDQMIPPGEQKVSKIMSEVSKKFKMCHLPWWFLV